MGGGAYVTLVEILNYLLMKHKYYLIMMTALFTVNKKVDLGVRAYRKKTSDTQTTKVVYITIVIRGCRIVIFL